MNFEARASRGMSTRERVSRSHIQRAREDGLDRSEGRKRGSFPVEIDDDVRKEYWRDIRGRPDRAHERVMPALGLIGRRWTPRR